MSNQTELFSGENPAQGTQIQFADITAVLNAIERRATAGIMGDVSAGHLRLTNDLYTVPESDHDRTCACADAARAFDRLLRACGIQQ